MDSITQRLLLRQELWVTDAHFSREGTNDEFNRALAKAVSFVRAEGAGVQVLVAAMKDQNETRLPEYCEMMRTALQQPGETLIFGLSWLDDHNCMLTITSTKVKK